MNDLERGAAALAKMFWRVKHAQGRVFVGDGDEAAAQAFAEASDSGRLSLTMRAAGVAAVEIVRNVYDEPPTKPDDPKPEAPSPATAPPPPSPTEPPSGATIAALMAED